MLKEVFDLALLAGHIYLTHEEREERRRQREREERRLAEREYDRTTTSQQGNSFSYSVKMENCDNCSVTISNTVEYHYYHE